MIARTHKFPEHKTNKQVHFKVKTPKLDTPKVETPNVETPKVDSSLFKNFEDFY
jgi:hypothetical protein